MRKMIYINLDDALVRREAIETVLRPACEANDLALVRLPASSAQSFAGEPAVPLSHAAQACWLSHERAIEMCADVLRPAHVIEDDVTATGQSLACVERLLSQLPEDTWDILFCDVCIAHPADMVNWFMSSLKLRQTGQFELVNLRGVNFAGMASYLINPRSAHKVLAALRGVTPRKLPIDIVMRNLVHAGTVKAFAVFPFLTTVSCHSSQSQIQHGAALSELAWDSFRRLVWLGAEPERVLDDLRRVVPDGYSSPGETALAELVRIIVSSNFIKK